MTSSSAPRRDLYAEITQTLIRQIEAAPGTPQMPWRRSRTTPLWMPKNVTTNNLYRGINVIMLWAAAEERGYTTPQWATYKQWQEMGAQVRGGEKGARIVKYGEYTIEPGDDAGDDDGRRLYLKGYTVFNASQVDGYELPSPPPSLGPVERIARAEAFIANTKARIEIGGERAYYRPSTDTIHMPDEGLFTGTETMTREEGFAATELHELGHWTSHKDRSDRSNLGKRFGDQAYAAEELVAEIFSAQACALLGVTQDVRADHAQYLAHWLDLMKSDAKAIFTAAAAASRALDYVISLQPDGFFPDLDTRAPQASEPADATSAPQDDDSAANAPARPNGTARRSRSLTPEA